jgi:hypothetical protein
MKLPQTAYKIPRIGVYEAVVTDNSLHAKELNSMRADSTVGDKEIPHSQPGESYVAR